MYIILLFYLGLDNLCGSGGAILTTLLLLAGVNFCWLRCDLSRLSNLTAGMKPGDGLDG